MRKAFLKSFGIKKTNRYCLHTSEVCHFVHLLFAHILREAVAHMAVGGSFLMLSLLLLAAPLGFSFKQLRSVKIAVLSSQDKQVKINYKPVA